VEKRLKVLKAIQVLNAIIYAEDTTNKLANKVKEARDSLYEVAEALEALEPKTFEEYQQTTKK
jgi:hypothetical protein